MVIKAYGFAAALVGGILLVALPQASASTQLAVMAASPAQEISGTGSDVPGLRPFREAVIVTMSHDGTSNFIVRPIDSAGEEGYSWANEIGVWTGTIFQEKGSKPIVAAGVDADGSWTIRVAPLASAPVVSMKAYAGAGDSVVQFRAASQGLKRIKLTHDGTSNFIVRPIDARGAEGYSLVNEIGPFTGTMLLPKGTRYLSVMADGNWSLKIS